MSQGNPTSQKAQEISSNFDSVGLDLIRGSSERDQPGTEEDWIQKLSSLPGDDGDKELSFAEINQKRKQLTFQAFRDEDFISKIRILDHLVDPNVECMYQLFRRTGSLSKLCYLPEQAAGGGESREKLVSELLDSSPMVSLSLDLVQTGNIAPNRVVKKERTLKLNNT